MKPDGYKFESLGWVRDGSESTKTKNVYKKGYHVTEATALITSNHPVSIFSEIHSSREKDFTSINDVTFSAMERAKALFGKATFVMDRGYDDNKMFLKLDSMKQDYVIRLTAKRKLLYHNKWTFATELRNIDDINGWLYHRIRMCIWKQWKKPKTKLRNLIKMGIPECYAHMVANSRRGHWFNANLTTVKRAMPKERLINSGFYDLATAYQSVHVNC